MFLFIYHNEMTIHETLLLFHQRKSEITLTDEE